MGATAEVHDDFLSRANPDGSRAGPRLRRRSRTCRNLAAQANDGRLDFMRDTGKDLWAYDEGHAQRTRNPYTYYRLKFWLAWKYRLDGCTYWKFAGDDVGIVYNPRLPDPDPLTSRRWEAWRKGLEDFKTLMALRERGVEQATLDEAVDEVISATGETGMADSILAILLTPEP